MTAEKENSISAENIEYIKNVEDKVEIIVCSSEDTFVSSVSSVAQQNYGISDSSATDYFSQTLTLINKYSAYNDNIDVRFVDVQSSQFTAIASTYGTDNLEYGGIIVSTDKADGTKRYKKLGFSDIYSLEEDETYAAYGMTMSNITGNNIETALTSAVAYVLSDVDVTVGLLTGHSSSDLTEDYKTLLKNNNYKVKVMEDSVIAKIPETYDIIVIPAPSKDFVETELNVIAEFLENGGKLGKGLMVFADASAPYLNNLYSFLNEWGIAISDGILYETSNYHLPDDPTTLYSADGGDVPEVADTALCITGSNVPMKPAFDEKGTRSTIAVTGTMDTSVIAPKGVSSEWAGSAEAEKGTFNTVIESTQVAYEDQKELSSKVAVFSSPFFLTSDYNESPNCSNKDFALAMVDRAAGAEDTGISFISKNVTSESFYDSVTEGSANAMRIIFMFILPLAVIAAGVVVFIKRRNA